jgi:hypothetical protein
MSSCDYCLVPFLSKTPRYIRRIPVHRLEDDEYRVNEDYWYEASYGLRRRTLTLEKTDGRVLYIFLPESWEGPKTSLVGGIIVKRTLKKNAMFSWRDRAIIILEFYIKECCV